MRVVILEMIELCLIALIGLMTIILQPPLPLLAIPFLVIISMRTMFGVLIIQEFERKLQ